ncbi:uncharacterized protein LOC122639399 [Telopea speciosissima]|uniref:uncharacterized protein LOC122639399 n=1 Tax=Telopea speciosissima TaxID=54955 RepID=UPI001CC47B41|nr:uncharacterized protein LOC122639399 [Telopea speciosissima]
MTGCSVIKAQFIPSSEIGLFSRNNCISLSFSNSNRILFAPIRFPRLLPTIRAAATMESNQRESVNSGVIPVMKLLFVEMGVGYDQHGQDITSAAMRACRDAISSNSIPAFRRGNIPGVSFDQMKLQIKLGVPRPLQQFLDIERVKSVFPYGSIMNVDIVDGGLICSSGVCVEEMGDKNDDCYVVNAAVYVGY